MNEKVLKNCAKHGDITKLEDLKIGVYNGKSYKKCRQCEIERSRKYYEKIYADPDKASLKREKDKKYWSDNKEAIKERRIQNFDAEKRREQYKKYAPRYREKCNEKQKKYREELHDTYIRKMIQNGDNNLSFSAIPDSLVKLKRAILLCKKGISKKSEFKLKEKIK